MKITYNGVTATEQYLTVYFTIHVGTAVKFGHVRVPLAEMLQPKITEEMDRLVRRRLIEAWSEVDIADPLF